MTGHPNIVDRRASIDWARHVLRKNRRYVILDTETTGVKKTDEIIQITVINLDGNALLNENIRPTKRRRIPKDATAIHGLTMDVLAECPICLLKYRGILSGALLDEFKKYAGV